MRFVESKRKSMHFFMLHVLCYIQTYSHNPQTYKTIYIAQLSKHTQYQLSNIDDLHYSYSLICRNMTTKSEMILQQFKLVELCF